MSISNIFNLSTHDRSLIWSYDPSPSTLEVPKTVELDLTGYTLLEVVCQQMNDSGPKNSTIIISDPNIASKQMISEGYATTNPHYRFVTITNSGLNFSTVYDLEDTENSIFQQDSLPIRIYGIR